MTGETSTPRCFLKLLEQTGLANASLSSNVDRVAAAETAAYAERRLKML
jgi:hypothetical protein